MVVTPFRIKDAKSVAHSSLAPFGGILNEKWCKIQNNYKLLTPSLVFAKTVTFEYFIAKYSKTLK